MAKKTPTPSAPKGAWKRPSGTSNDSTLPTGRFQTMGNGPASAVNASGAPSRNMIPGGPSNSSAGGMLEGATQARRTPKINEPNGPQHRITASAYPPATNPEANLNYRNVRLVPSTLGNRDFWDKRNNGV